MKISTLRLLAWVLLSSTLVGCGASAPKESELNYKIAWSTQEPQEQDAMVSMSSDGTYAIGTGDVVQRYTSTHEELFSAPVSGRLGAVAAAQDGSTYASMNNGLTKLDANGDEVWSIVDRDIREAQGLRETDSGAIVGYSQSDKDDAFFFGIAVDGSTAFKQSMKVPWSTPFAISHDANLIVGMPCSDGSGATCIDALDSAGNVTEWARSLTFDVAAIAWAPDGGVLLGATTTTTSSVLDVLGLQYDSTQLQDFLVRLAPDGTTMWVESVNGAPVTIDASVGQITVASTLAPGDDANAFVIAGYSLDGTAGPALASNLQPTALTGGEEGRVMVTGLLRGIFTDGTQTVTGNDVMLSIELALR